VYHFLAGFFASFPTRLASSGGGALLATDYFLTALRAESSATRHCRAGEKPVSPGKQKSLPKQGRLLVSGSSP
jgi:hypothetical protein